MPAAVNALLARDAQAKRAQIVRAGARRRAAIEQHRASPTCATSARATRSPSTLPLRDLGRRRRGRCCARRSRRAIPRLFGRADPGRRVEVLSLVDHRDRRRRRPAGSRAGAATAAAALEPAAAGCSIRPLGDAMTCRSTGASTSPPAAGSTGPALIAEDETTTVVPPASTPASTRFGHIVLERGGLHDDARTTPSPAIRMQVMWNRLIAVVEEQAQTLLRTAFGDRSCAKPATSRPACSIRHGRMLAQAVTGTPGHVNSMAHSRSAISSTRFPVDDDAAGRRLHHQRSLARHRPSLRLRRRHARPSSDGRLVALFASTAHVVDIGGIGFGPDGTAGVRGRPVHPDHEAAPKRGRINETLLRIVRANVREPVAGRGRHATRSSPATRSAAGGWST